MAVGSPLTVAGAAAELRTRHCCRSTRTAFPWLPLARNHHHHARIGVRTSQEVPLPANLEGLLKMRKLSIIGIGTGNADHITVQAIKALASVDVVFLIGKGNDKEDLAQLRKDLCARYIGKPYRIVEAQDPERDRTPADYETA